MMNICTYIKRILKLKKSMTCLDNNKENDFVELFYLSIRKKSSKLMHLEAS